MRARIIITLSALCGLLVAGHAHAWTAIGGSRPTWSGTVPYALNQDGSADLGGYDATLTVVRQAMDDWARVSCTSLTTHFTGSTSGRAFGSGGENSLAWYESGWFDSSSTIGITGPSWDSSNHIVSAEMALNAVHYTWVTGSGSGSRVNAYSIVLHEGGHYYGLGHSSDPSSTMYYAYSGGIDMLNSDDQEGICTLYPGSGGGPTDPPPGGDPPPTDPPPSGGSICASCRTDADCPGKCLRYPDGLACGADCSSDADCGGDSCETVSDGSRQCVRRASDGSADCSGGPTDPPPDPPPTDPPPTPPPSDPPPSDPPTDPPPEDPPTDPPADPPRRGLGEACSTNDDCLSNICAVDTETGETFCTQLCGAGSECPAGFSCEDAGGGTSACRPDIGAIGAGCRAPGDCLSGLCAELSDGRRFCTEACDGSSPCPEAFLCVDTSDGAASICLPYQPNGAVPRGLVGGCSVSPAGDGHTGGWTFALAAFLFLARRRRRS